MILKSFELAIFYSFIINYMVKVIASAFAME